MIEIHWGDPISFIIPPTGEVQKFSTIEQARYWLDRKWPITDRAQGRALRSIDAAMACMAPVGVARQSFVAAAESAGFVPASRAA